MHLNGFPHTNTVMTRSSRSRSCQRCPQEQHHLVLQRTMRYLKETRTLGITYGLERNVLGEDLLEKDLYGYTDSEGVLRVPSASERRRTSVPTPSRVSASSHMG